MFTFLTGRIEAARLAGNLRSSLLDEGDAWTVENGTRHLFGAAVANGEFQISITPRAVRLFDRIHLYCDGSEVWLPMISRIRLRNAVRLLVARHADMLWQQRRQNPSAERQSRSA